LDIERKNATPKEELKKLMERVEKNDKGKERFFFGHCGVQTGEMNEYNDLEAIKNNEDTNTTTTPLPVKKKKFLDHNPNHLDCNDLDSTGADYVFLGDFHKHHFLDTQKCRAMYTGCIEKYNMHEIDHKKGFVVYDSEMEITDEKYGKTYFVEYPNCRPMVELKGNFQQIQEQWRKVNIEKNQGAIFKATFEGSSNELIDFSAGLQQFKAEVTEKISPIHFFTNQKVKDDGQRELATELQKEIMEKGHIGANDIINIVKEDIRERADNEEEAKATIALAEEIYKESVEK
jgi:DNA repair exonuclease SbcCD nuclease subunit